MVYPEGISQMPLSTFWSIIFFFMLFTLGLDSQVRYYEGFFYSIKAGLHLSALWSLLFKKSICQKTNEAIPFNFFFKRTLLFYDVISSSSRKDWSHKMRSQHVHVEAGLKRNFFSLFSRWSPPKVQSIGSLILDPSDEILSSRVLSHNGFSTTHTEIIGKETTRFEVNGQYAYQKFELSLLSTIMPNRTMGYFFLFGAPSKRAINR